MFSQRSTSLPRAEVGNVDVARSMQIKPAAEETTHPLRLHRDICCWMTRSPATTTAHLWIAGPTPAHLLGRSSYIDVAKFGMSTDAHRYIVTVVEIVPVLVPGRPSPSPGQVRAGRATVTAAPRSAVLSHQCLTVSAALRDAIAIVAREVSK